MGAPLYDLLALGLGHAASDGNQHLGALLHPRPLHLPDLAQFGIDLFSRLFADVAVLRMTRSASSGAAVST